MAGAKGNLPCGGRPREVLLGFAAEGSDYFPVILNRVVPQVAHLPFRAWRLFPNFTSFGLSISLLFLSFTQYAFIVE